MEPSLPVHTVGLADVILPMVGVGGKALMSTSIDAAGDTHPATVWVTLIV